MAKAKFTKGLHTRGTIMATAKILFYNKGYDNTSIKEICEVANINTGTFSYYFGKKEFLARAIYEDLLVLCYSFVTKEEKQLNSLQKNTRAILIYYLTLLKDGNTRAYHSEVLKHQSVNDYMARNLSHIYQQFVTDLKLNITKSELNNLALADGGSRKELVLNFIKNPSGQSIYDLVNTIHIFMGRLFVIDEQLMKAYLFEAMEFEKKYDHSHIKFLV